MNSKTHKVGGVCAGIGTITLLAKPSYTISSLILSGSFLAGSYLGSLLPDIDHKGSTIGRKFKATSCIVSKTCGHRGFTHAPVISLVSVGGLLAISIFFDNSVKNLYIDFISGILVGSLSHILLDSLTVEGVPFFYPLSKKKHHLLPLRTGESELLVQTIIIMLTALLIYKI